MILSRRLLLRSEYQRNIEQKGEEKDDDGEIGEGDELEEQR